MLDKVVLTFGAWDIIHTGHVKFLQRASQLGSVVVGVQSDVALAQCKQVPVMPQIDRLQLVSSISCVENAVIYDFDYVEVFNRVRADVLVMSESHRYTHRLQELYHYVDENKGKDALVFLPYDYSVSSSSIKNSIRQGQWSSIWEDVALSDKTDYEICGYASQEDTIAMANYIRDRINISKDDAVLDYGCGSGVIMSSIQMKSGSVGIDVSNSMLLRAFKNNPHHVFLCCGDLSRVLVSVDKLYSWGVFQYLESYDQADGILRDMYRLCKGSILIMEIPDISRKAEREENRRVLGMAQKPEHLYYNKEFFEERGFVCEDNDIFLTKNSKYSFTAIRRV